MAEEERKEETKEESKEEVKEKAGDEAEKEGDNPTDDSNPENNSDSENPDGKAKKKRKSKSDEDSEDKKNMKDNKGRLIWRSQREDLQKLCKILMYVTTGVVAVFTVLFAILIFGDIEMTMSETIKYYINIYLPFMFAFMACWLTSLGIVLFWRRYPSWISTRKVVTFWTVIDLIQVVFQLVSWYSIIGSL